jgi:hypothetical protein
LEASPGKFARPIFKITRTKWWTGGMDQAVECLLCKYKALTKKKKMTYEASLANRNPEFKPQYDSSKKN